MRKRVYSEMRTYDGNWNILVPSGKENKYVIPLLAASEKGTGQTESPFEKKVEMWWVIIPKLTRGNFLERNALEGDSPVI